MDSEAPHARGLALTALGRIEAAEQAYSRALNLDPRHARAWLDLGLLYQRSGRQGKAREALTVLSQLDPQAARQLSDSLEPR